MEEIADRLKTVQDKIAAAESARPPANQEEVTLVAISKTHPVDVIQSAIDAGCRAFGENRVQEAGQKWPELKAKTSDVTLHLIGPLQSNKVKEAVALFDVIETVDRKKIAAALAREMEKQDKALRLYVQVNIGMEGQKSGIAPDETVAFVAHCRDDLNLEIEGLMCIPPAGEDPVPYFQNLAKLADEAGVKCRSMGMSGDYELAIANGATSVRVGSAIFGHRAYK